MNSNNILICFICGKNFNSKKALSGHTGWHTNSDRNMLGANKGQVAWNRGFRGEGMPMFGRHHSKETIKKMRIAHKRTWADPKFKSRRTKEIQELCKTQKYKESHTKGVRKVVKTKEYRKALMAGIQRRGSNPNWLKSLCQGIWPNNPEKILIKLLQKLFPNQWRYVGNGSFWLTSGGQHINPDFVNTDGQKKVIEMFGDYWHGEEKTGRVKEEEEQQRIDCFTKLGYQTLIIWEKELTNTEKLMKKIVDFNEVVC